MSDKLKGVLTVHLIRCINLLGDEPTTYVRMLVSDEESDQIQKSRLVFKCVGLHRLLRCCCQ